MRKRTVGLLWAALALVSAAALLPAPATDASFFGAWDKRQTGCYCHSYPADPDVRVAVEGFPARYEVGASYNLTIRLVSTDVNLTGDRQAGFNAEVTQGTFAVPPGWDDLVQAQGVQATHRLNGTHQTNWSVVWRAPTSPSGGVALWVLVNTVNGNGVPDSGDHWSSEQFIADGPSPPQPFGSGFVPAELSSDPWALGGVVGAALAGAATAGALLWRARAKRRREEALPGHRRRAPPRRRKRPPRHRPASYAQGPPPRQHVKGGRRKRRRPSTGRGADRD